MKNNEPEEWTKFRQTEGARYESKTYLREALYREQGGICAYCMQRLKNELKTEKPRTIVVTNDQSNRIEHIKCRDSYPNLQLDYSNMLLCCSGKATTDETYNSCDRAKENKDISFTPLDINFINTLSYKSLTGEIKSSNSTWNQELNTVLNLNHALLKANRAAVLKGIRTKLQKKKWKISELKKQRKRWDTKDGEGLFKPYCGIVVWYLDTKIK